MASAYTYPQDHIRWFLDGGRLVIVTSDVDDSGDNFQSIDESVENAVLVKYVGGQEHIDPSDNDVEKQFPPVHYRIHPAVVDYVFARLYMEKPDITEVEVVLSKQYFGMFWNKVHRFNGGKPRPRTRKVIPSGVGALV